VDGALGEVGVALVVRDIQMVAPLRCRSRSSSSRLHRSSSQVSGGLVSHEDERIPDQRARDSDTLLLTPESCEG